MNFYCFLTATSYHVIFSDGRGAGPAKLPARLYKSLGPMMRPATAEAAVTAGLAR
jgi:hypothetical protein